LIRRSTWGPNRAIRILQEATGCEADGMFGERTKAACDSCELGEAPIKYCEGLYRNFATRPG
jgi:lysozyme family protein